MLNFTNSLWYLSHSATQGSVTQTLPIDLYITTASTTGTAWSNSNVTTLLGQAWTQGQYYTTNQYAYANGNIYQNTVANCVSSIAGSGPSGTGSSITDGTCSWNYSAGNPMPNNLSAFNGQIMTETLTVPNTGVRSVYQLSTVSQALSGTYSISVAQYQGRRIRISFGLGLSGFGVDNTPQNLSGGNPTINVGGVYYAATATGSASSSTTLTVSGVTGAIQPGQALWIGGSQSGGFVTAVNGSSITISQAVTASGPVQFAGTDHCFSGVQVNFVFKDLATNASENTVPAGNPFYQATTDGDLRSYYIGFDSISNFFNQVDAGWSGGGTNYNYEYCVNQQLTPLFAEVNVPANANTINMSLATVWSPVASATPVTVQMSPYKFEDEGPARIQGLPDRDPPLATLPTVTATTSFAESSSTPKYLEQFITNDVIPVAPSSGNITITLPSSDLVRGRAKTFVNVTGGYHVYLTASTGDTILYNGVTTAGAGTYDMGTVAGASVRLLPTGLVAGSGAKWEVLDAPNPLGINQTAVTSSNITSCGTSPAIDASANRFSGKVTIGTSATGCVVTWPAAYQTYSHCRVSFEGINTGTYTYSLTALTISGSSLSSAVFDYECDGQ